MSARKLFDDPRAPYFLATMLVFGVAMGMFGGVMNNYLHDVLHIGKMERGMVEFPRELPGLLVVGLIALLHRVPDMRILRLALFSGAMGMVGLSVAGEGRVAAITMIVMWSLGEHLIMPVSPSVAMHMAQPGRAGAAMGAVSSAMSIGQVAGYYLVPVLFVTMLGRWTANGAFGSFQVTFAGAAVVLVAALLLSTKLHGHGEVKRERLHFDRKFGRFYVLELLFGARKQVFITFAPYVLIVVYGAPTAVLASLYGACAVLNIFVGPLVGRLIDRVGYRAVLIVDAALLLGLCLVYGFSHRVLPHHAAYAVVGAAFVLDAVLFVVGLARNMLVKELSASPEEVTSALSTGVSINHLVSIGIAMLGGMVWEHTSVEVLFSLAAVFAVGSFLFTLSLPKGRA